jgi:hypoxanthine phosphoribosyltransferase
MHPDLERVLFTEEQIRARVGEVAAEISADYAGKEITMITVLRGAVFFAVDLARAVSVPVRMDYLAVSPFPLGERSGAVRIAKDLDESIAGRDALLVEDIVDTGLTLRYLMKNLSARQPATLAVCTLLDKTPRRLIDVPVRYRCFEIPDRFVVGYGLDYQQHYRNLPYVGVLKPELFRGGPSVDDPGKGASEAADERR